MFQHNFKILIIPNFSCFSIWISTRVGELLELQERTPTRLSNHDHGAGCTLDSRQILSPLALPDTVPNISGDRYSHPDSRQIHYLTTFRSPSLPIDYSEEASQASACFTIHEGNLSDEMMNSVRFQHGQERNSVATDVELSSRYDEPPKYDEPPPYDVAIQMPESNV